MNIDKLKEYDLQLWSSISEELDRERKSNPRVNFNGINVYIYMYVY